MAQLVDLAKQGVPPAYRLRSPPPLPLTLAFIGGEASRCARAVLRALHGNQG